MKRKAKQHIFFVDDEPTLRKVVRRTLQRTGLKVSCFGSAADCLKKLHSVKCDLLITDVKMPKMDGVTVVKDLREDKKCKGIPILLWTNLNENKVQETVKDLKCEYLAKAEWSLKDLVDKVKKEIK